MSTETVPERIQHERATHSIMDKLFSDGVLIDLDVRFWRAVRANGEKDLGVKRSKLPEFVVGLGTKRLLPKEDIARWVSHADRARYLIAKASFRFPIGEGQFVPMANVESLSAELDEVKKEFEATAEDFLRNYARLRREYLERFPEHRERLEKQYPTREELESKFSFEYRLFSVSMPKAMRKRQAEDAAVAKYQTQLEGTMNRFIREAVTTLRTQTVEVCEGLSQKILKGEVVSRQGLDQIRSFVERFKGLNFIGDTEVEAKLEEVKRLVGNRTAAEYESDDAGREALGRALRGVAEVAKGIKDVNLITAEYHRRIKT